jgi:DDE superfamily endonuclease
MSFEHESSSSLQMDSQTTRSVLVSIRLVRSSASGASGSSSGVWRAWRRSRGAGDRPAFPPSVVVAIKALACQLPREHGLPFSRWSVPEFRGEVLRRGLVASVGETTLWRWLTEDALRPWCHRSWIFPRAPDFEEKAGKVLDLYSGSWEGVPLSSEDCVISTDEKTSIQARQRKHPTAPPRRKTPIRVEHEYKRLGAWVYLAAWDVRNAKVFGRCERKMGSAPFDCLVAEVMEQEPYRSARRVFWIMDNCSSHRGESCSIRLTKRWKNIIVVHTPVHASWLNQVEIYFSVLQRKVLTPNDFSSLTELGNNLLAFQRRYSAAAKPFQWKFTRADLAKLLAKIAARDALQAAA